jgi:glycosyltransferase involved in cell wall biosynthesis
LLLKELTLNISKITYRKLKILFCISSLTGGGAETQLYYLSTELSKIGHEVHVFYICDSSNIKKNWGSVNLHECNAKSNYSLKIFLDFFKLLNNFNFDIVQSWVVQMDIISGLFVSFFKFKWIIREPSSSKNYNSSFKNKLRVFLSQKAAVIVSNSIQGKLYWESKNNLTIKRIVLNGIPYDKIENAIRNSKDVKFSFNDYIIYVGRLVDDGTAKKNISNLILAFDQVNKKKRNLKLLIVGEGKDLNKFKLIVKQLKIDESVFFLGHQKSETVYQLMKNSLLFVSLSEFEGCPNTVLEALYTCDRILLSNIEEHISIFPNSNDNLFVNPNNLDEIVDNMITLIESSPKRNSYSKLTYKYRTERMICDYTSLYSELLLNSLDK